MDALLGLALLLVSAALTGVIWLARQGRVGSRTLIVLAVFCAGALLLMLVTDWPWEVLAPFWAAHSVLAGVLSTVLMLGIGFLIFEVWDLSEQEHLDRSLTAAGMGGLVDHLVEVEVALAIVLGRRPPDELGWVDWGRSTRPLRWLRDERERLHRRRDGLAGANDPRGWPVDAAALEEHAEWRAVLVDQCVRRLLAAIRDWAPVIGRSRTGMRALISLADVRNALMAVEAALAGPEERAAPGVAKDPAGEIGRVRRQCRLMALALEMSSFEGNEDPERLVREEVLLTWSPLGAVPPTSGPGLLKDDWSRSLDRSAECLGRRR